MSKKNPFKPGSWIGHFILKTLFFIVGIGVCGAIMIALMVSLVWPNLPNLNAMTDYRPRIPLRIYSSDKVLLAEYGEERRNVLQLSEIPDVMKKAVMAAEDDNFYEHSGVDWSGVARAAIANITTGAKAQGASTITMQVARNFYLSNEKSFIRKFYELLLTYKIEHTLSKNQILELYMNQIYLGHRSYGFSAASRTYFGKPLSEITLAEAAILAGIPKAPSSNNPKTNFKRAIERQHYVLERMLKLGWITQEQYDQALAEKVQMRGDGKSDNEGLQVARHGQYVAELARQLMYDIYKDNVYGRGLNVYVTVNSKDQAQAYYAVRNNVLNYTRRKPYPGPEAQLDLPVGLENDPQKMGEFLREVKQKYPNNDDLLSAVVLSASPKQVDLMYREGEVLSLKDKELNNAKRALTDKASGKQKIRRGSVVYIQNQGEKGWDIINLPRVEGAFIALNPQDGAIAAMVGGFHYESGNFNRVTQAWRQPGSTFKPFIYAAGLERGLTPETNISNGPFVLTAKQTGSKPWTPKNYGGTYTYSHTMRSALYKSVNLVSIRILQAVGPDFSREFIQRFGFDLNRQPPRGAYLTMALGAGSVTPLQMAGAYSVFANGGYHISPYLIERVEDSEGHVLMQAQPAKAGEAENRVLDPRTAYLMNNLLHGVATSGTAARITAVLKRPDLHGKTGTTNQSFDAWFVGYTPKLLGVAWFGFDQPRSLGSRETGGGLAMPMWLDYMGYALKDVPVVTDGSMPKGLIASNGNFYYSEFPPGKAVENVGLSGPPPSDANSSGSGAVSRSVESFNPFGGPPIKF